MSNEKDIKVEESDVENRTNNLNKELVPLLRKYQLKLGATPFLTKDGRIAAIPQVFDNKKVESSTISTEDTDDKE